MKTNESLKITVFSQTADALRRMSAKSNLTVGEVVDQLAVNSSPTDPVLASLLITQKALMILSNLDAEDHQKANTYLAYSIMSREWIRPVPLFVLADILCGGDGPELPGKCPTVAALECSR